MRLWRKDEYIFFQSLSESLSLISLELSVTADSIKKVNTS